MDGDDGFSKTLMAIGVSLLYFPLRMAVV